jgi:hypothetical protein
VCVCVGIRIHWLGGLVPLTLTLSAPVFSELEHIYLLNSEGGGSLVLVYKWCAWPQSRASIGMGLDGDALSLCQAWI